MDYKKLSKLIQKELFEEDEDNTIYPRICNLHSSFDNCDFIGDSEKSHNCLGCNYANYTWGLLHTIESWSMYELSNTKKSPFLSIHTENFFPVSNIFHWLNILVDSYIEVLKVIEISEERRLKLFRSFQRIKVWTNFFKHPKAMIYTHHANFTFETSSNTKDCFNENDIKKYYSGNKKETNDTLFNRISNRVDLTIVLPDLFEIIKVFSKDTDIFIELITENKLFRDELNQKCTFENYYDSVDSNNEDSKTLN